MAKFIDGNTVIMKNWKIVPNPPFEEVDNDYPMRCPQEGVFIGYKCAICFRWNDNFKAAGEMCRMEPYIVKLEIPADAKRSSAKGNKCRCNKAKVLEITTFGGEKVETQARSIFDKTFIYKVGEMVSVDDFCEDRWRECAPGIHFFMDVDEALNYFRLMR